MQKTRIETLPLRTPRLWLRPYRPGDQGAFCSLMGDADVNRYVEGRELTSAEATTLFHKVFPIYADGRFAVWAVQDAASSAYIGHAELKPRAGEAGLELIYLLRRSSWGAGLGTELARALRDYALQSLAVSRVIATIHPDNEASKRILVKLNFEFVREWKEPGDDAVTCLWAFEAER